LAAEQHAERRPLVLRGWWDPDGMMFPKVDVPTAVASFPEEPWRVPRRWAELRFDIRRWTDMPRGGPFAALEEPEPLTDDVRSFFRLAARQVVWSRLIR
jgi:hypothetical protein